MQLHYKTIGEGHPIIILHGLYGSSDSWLNIGKKLSSTHKVYLIDQRNHGNSPHFSSHTYKDLKVDLETFVKYQKLKKFTLIGHSMGGKTAIYYSLLSQESIKNLIVVDISTRDYNKINNNIIQTKNHTQILRAMKKVNLSQISSRSMAENMLAKDLKNKRLRSFLLKNLRRTSRNSFEWKINLKVIQANITNMLKGVHVAHNLEFSKPALFIRAENSKYILEDDYFCIRKLFPKAEITTIPNADHWVHIDQPELVIKTIRYFIS